MLTETIMLSFKPTIEGMRDAGKRALVTALKPAEQHLRADERVEEGVYEAICRLAVIESNQVS